MLNCKQIMEMASDYNDNKLSRIKRMSFLMHILLCHHCRRFVKQFKLMISTLGSSKQKTDQDSNNFSNIIQIYKEEIATFRSTPK